MIHEFDDEEQLNLLKNSFEIVEKIHFSFSDRTSEYRSFYQSLEINLAEARNIIERAEYSLLIECYTYSERLLKNTIYQCLEFDKSKNEYLNSFMLSKLSPDRFSPNPKFKDFESELKIISRHKDYKFLIENNNSNVRVYNEMIQSRHRYAHANEYPIPYTNYKDSIIILEYLTWECKMFLNDIDKKEKIQNSYASIKDDAKKLSKLSDNKILRGINKQKTKNVDVLLFRKKVKSFLKEYGENLEELEVFKEKITQFKQVSQLNFNINTINDLKNICVKILQVN